MDQAKARAVADPADGSVLASVEIAAPPERTFRALVSEEIVRWWVRPGVFDTSEWTGDIRPGGGWRSSGIGGGRPYGLEGEFLEIDPPRKLVHTWHMVGTPVAPTTVTYLLEPVDRGTRVTLRHEGFLSPEACSATCIGWETSFERLAELMTMEPAPGSGLPPDAANPIRTASAGSQSRNVTPSAGVASSG